MGTEKRHQRRWRELQRQRRQEQTGGPWHAHTIADRDSSRRSDHRQMQRLPTPYRKGCAQHSVATSRSSDNRDPTVYGGLIANITDTTSRGGDDQHPLEQGRVDNVTVTANTATGRGSDSQHRIMQSNVSGWRGPKRQLHLAQNTE